MSSFTNYKHKCGQNAQKLSYIDDFNELETSSCSIINPKIVNSSLESTAHSRRNSERCNDIVFIFSSVRKLNFFHRKSKKKMVRKEEKKNYGSLQVHKYAAHVLSNKDHPIHMLQSPLSVFTLAQEATPIEEQQGKDEVEILEDDAPGSNPAENDDPFNQHWNNFHWNCQERPAMIDMGYDDSWKSFWNHDFWNTNKYNVATAWHDLMNMYSYSPTYDNDQLEQSVWNATDWNTISVQATAIDEVVGRILEVDQQDNFVDFF